MVNKQLSLALLLIPALAVLSSCTWFGGGSSSMSSKSSGPAFVTINGKTAVTVDEFKDTFEQFKRQQALDQAFDAMPAKDKMNICSRVADSLVEGAIIEEYVKSQGWDNTKEFNKELEKITHDVARQLRVREFVNRMLVEFAPADQEAEEFYINNRSANFNFRRPPFLSQPDGVISKAVKLSSESAAKDLLAKAKKAGSLEKAAKEVKATLEDLGPVSPWSSNVDFMVVQKVLGMKDLPSFDMTPAADKKSFYVVQGISRTEPEFADFAAVAKEVKDIIAAERFGSRFPEKLKELKERYKAVMNEEALKELVGMGACELGDLIQEEAFDDAAEVTE
ncbi:MAG: hypothetical protein UV79_C0017G0003 [candidate division TM6 bacterium GW2011_GWF2_43_17]|nr:MAG: hypothetical protein UV79_C0017G0003 [candidate division TM6 bacterium GW2011_GWF2_43_17]HAU30687.1 hypothetical protein [Candidatus Dependentiae bacterium]